MPHKPTDRPAIPHKPTSTERKHQEKDRSDIPHKQISIPHKNTSKQKERIVITIEDDEEENNEGKYDQEVIHREQNDHDPIDVVQLKKDVPVVIEEMRKLTPKKLTSIENKRLERIERKTLNKTKKTLMQDNTQNRKRIELKGLPDAQHWLGKHQRLPLLG